MNPIILGRGLPLFINGIDKTGLELKSTRSFDCGVTELSYLVDGR